MLGFGTRHDPAGHGKHPGWGTNTPTAATQQHQQEHKQRPVVFARRSCVLDMIGLCISSRILLSHPTAAAAADASTTTTAAAVPVPVPEFWIALPTSVILKRSRRSQPRFSQTLTNSYGKGNTSFARSMGSYCWLQCRPYPPLQGNFKHASCRP